MTVAAESDAETDTEADEAAAFVSAETEAELEAEAEEAEAEGGEAEGEEAEGEEAEGEAVAVPRAAFDAVVPLSLPPPPPPQAAIKRLIVTAMKVRDSTTGRSDFVMAKRNTEWANESRIHEAGASHQACPHADDR